MSTTNPLSGCVIVNTRPTHQAAALTEPLTSLGARVIALPALAIEWLATPQQLARLPRDAIVIFTSANAVLAVTPYWQHNTHCQLIIAIGPGTQQALLQHQIRCDLLPAEFNSEGLCQLEELMPIQQQPVVIFCGVDNRPLLPNTLRERGALVEEFTVYRRIAPTISAGQCRAVSAEPVTHVICTSLSGLSHFYQSFLPLHAEWLKSLTFVVISPAMTHWLQQQKHEGHILQADNASTQAIIEALVRHVKANDL